MKTKRILIASIFAAAAALFLCGGSRADDVTVSVDSPAVVSQGDSFAVDVDIANATDVYDFQLDLDFDPSVLQATDVSEGAFLTTDGSTFFFPGFIDNSAGNITFNADTLIGAISGADGSGTLLQVDFQALATGTSSLDLDNLILQDSLGDALDASTTHASVTVTSSRPIPAPEPNSRALLAIGTAACLILPMSVRRGCLRKLRGVSTGGLRT